MKMETDYQNKPGASIPGFPEKMDFWISTDSTYNYRRLNRSRCIFRLSVSE